MARPLYPMFLDLSGRLIVVVGGGKVAARKVAGLVKAGAQHIRLIAPELRGEFSPDVADRVEHVAEHYHPANLDGAHLVFAATDVSHVNDAVVRDAHERGVFVCRADADDDSPGDFITPAQFDVGPIHVTVSAGSAALSAAIRNQLRQDWRHEWTAMAEFLQTHRPRVVGDARLTAEQRRDILRSLAAPEAVRVLSSEGEAGLLRWLSARHPEWANGD